MKRLLLSLSLGLVAFGAGCSRPTTPPVSPTTPATIQSETSQNSTKGWQEVENRPHGFAFKLPPIAKTASLDEQDALYSYDLGTQAVSATAESFPETTLSISLLEASDDRLQDCFYVESGWADGYTPARSERVTLNNRSVCLTVEQDAGAGNRYTSYSYATVLEDGSYVVMRFVVHSVECANYENPDTQCVAFDEARDTKQFNDIVSSLRFFASSPATVIDQSLFKKQVIEEDGKGYIISVSYPRLDGFADTEMQTLFNTLIENRVKNRIAEFKKNADEMGGAEFETVGTSWGMDENFSIYPGAYGRFSVVMSGSEYTGGAHPNPYYDTVVFDISKRTAMKLSDVFKPGTKYLEAISAYTHAELERQNDVSEFSDEDWLKEGTNPEEQNFQFFYLTSKGLVIIFPPYQVAAYAAGPIEVEIPFTELKTILAL
jgi:hypothetical protein